MMTKRVVGFIWLYVCIQFYRNARVGIAGEMYGWSLAAVHLGLPHTLAESFIVSSVDVSSGEGWPLIDALGDDEICDYSTLKEKVGKYRLDSDFWQCEKPLLLEPPKDIGKQYDFYIKPGGIPYGENVKLQSRRAKREQFMICQMIQRLNDAATWYKSQTCEEGTVNLEKSLIFH